MIETNSSVAQAPAMSHAQRQALAQRQARAVRVEALRRAKAETKHQLAARGLKLMLIPAREIVVMAEAYVASHPELIAEARETVLRWTAEGFFGKRAAQAAHNSRVMSKEERPATQGLLLNETHSQNGAAR
jgi:hypothetical protein